MVQQSEILIASDTVDFLIVTWNAVFRITKHRSDSCTKMFLKTSLDADKSKSNFYFGGREDQRPKRKVSYLGC